MAARHKNPLLEHLAARVRAARGDFALTRREVASGANISERFLVMVENGMANLSVLKLDAIAEVFGTTASALLGDQPLVVDRGTFGSGNVVALLGLRGAGKSTVGARVARRLGWPFIELDVKVAERAGLSLAEIFELHGAAYYRKLEREVLEKVFVPASNCVVAVGGGIVADQQTYDFLRKWATTVWLKAKPEDHMTRVVAQGDSRPMANRRDAMSEIRGLLRARRPLYELADHVVDTSSLGLEKSVDRVVRIAREPGRRAAAPS